MQLSLHNFPRDISDALLSEDSITSDAAFVVNDGQKGRLPYMVTYIESLFGRVTLGPSCNSTAFKYLASSSHHYCSDAALSTFDAIYFK